MDLFGICVLYAKKDNDCILNEESFYDFLNKITGFIWTYAVINPGVNALRTPVYAEMINLVNNKPVLFEDFKFEESKIRNIFSNFNFNNSRPITKSMIAWWAFQDEEQELLPIETILEIEHIYAKNRQGIENNLKNVNNIEALGNKVLLEKRINIRASDYRFEDKKNYYLGFTNRKNQKKEGTKIKELITLAKQENRIDFTETDIEDRTNKIMNNFIEFLSQNMLISE